MLGGSGGSGLEAVMDDAIEAAALDTIEAALATQRFERALLLARSRPSRSLPEGVTLDLDSGRFHFGERLAGCIAERGLGSVLYLGGGSAPLLEAGEFEALAGGIAGDGPSRIVSNNFYSADLFALAPAALFGDLDPLPRGDNIVPRLLREQQQVAGSELTRSLATQFNLDTPVDLAALWLSGRGGPRLREALNRWAPPVAQLQQSARRFTDSGAEVLVAGRASSRTWQYLERETACRVRMLSEERGMGAAGRDADGTARSLLGALIEAVGPRRFFVEQLPQLCDAAFIDLRPALVHLALRPSRADRFAADLALATEIDDEGLRAIVEAANDSPVPVVLGGHSLVAASLMLLNDWAWEQLDGRRLPASEPR